MKFQSVNARSCISTTVIILFSLLANAQAPLQFNFQGAARDNTGALMTDKDIKVRLTVRNDTLTGASEYTETRLVRTNQFGMFSITIGSSGAFSSSGSLKDVKWETGRKFLQVEVDPKGGNNFINIGATQLLSVPFALFSLQSAKSTSTASLAASNGLSLADSTLQIGNIPGDSSSRFLNDRVIPLNGNFLQLKDGLAKLQFSKSLITLQQDSVLNEELKSGGPFLIVNPIVPNPDAVPFLFSKLSNPQYTGSVSPNEVVIWGHNLDGRGRLYIPGLPAIGYSLESNYRPDPTTRFVESHEYYVTPLDKQIRLKSYTINTVTDHVDFYHSVDNFSLRKPLTAKEYFFVANNGSSTTALWETNNGLFSIRAADDRTVVLENGYGTSGNLVFHNWGSVILPGIIQAGGNNRFTANTFPEKDYTYSMGNYANRWTDVASLQFSGEKMILKSGWAAYENIKPTSTLDIVGQDGFSQLRMRQSYTPTSSKDPNGEIGSTAWDNDYIYIKTPLGWKRSNLSAF